MDVCSPARNMKSLRNHYKNSKLYMQISDIIAKLKGRERERVRESVCVVVVVGGRGGAHNCK